MTCRKRDFNPCHHRLRDAIECDFLVFERFLRGPFQSFPLFDFRLSQAFTSSLQKFFLLDFRLPQACTDGVANVARDMSNQVLLADRGVGVRRTPRAGSMRAQGLAHADALV